MPAFAAPAPLDLFDRPEAADPSPRAAELLALNPAADLLHEARPGYADPPPPFYASPDGHLRLYQADALELLRRMRDESVDMVFADPPYFLSNGGITCVGGKMVTVDKGGWDKSQGIIGDHNFNLLWLDQCRRILKPNGTIWVTGTSHNIHSVGYALQVLDYKILNDIAWYKVNPPPNLACRYFTHATETILWAAKSVKSKHTFHYALMKEQNGGKQMQSLWNIMFIGIEREQDYLTLAVRRIEEETQQATLVFVFAQAPFITAEDVKYKREWNTLSTWDDIVSYALTTLGGEGDLREINRLVERSPRTESNPTWPSTVRRVVRQSPRISAVRRGRYRLWQN